MSRARVLDVGPLARLVEVAPGTAAAWATALRADDIAGVVDIVPAARTVLVRVRRPLERGTVTSRLSHLDAIGSCDGSIVTRRDRVVVEIPVVYDGDDLDDVARGDRPRTRRGHRQAHRCRRSGSTSAGSRPGSRTSPASTRRCGCPRRSTPRTRVPAGSVAIASEYSAVYPGVSPGGWHLLGTTTARVWDADRVPPALLEPGTEVRFVRSVAHMTDRLTGRATSGVTASSARDRRCRLVDDDPGSRSTRLRPSRCADGGA